MSKDKNIDMQMVDFGDTGLQVSRLGAGLAEIGMESGVERDQAAKVLNSALDMGINF